MALFPLKPFENIPFINFMAWRRFWIWSSVACVLATFVLLAKPGLNFGIDFVGGKLVQVQTTNPVPVASVRQAVDDAGFVGANIQEFENGREFLVRLSASDAKAAAEGSEKIVVDTLAPLGGGAELRRVEFVGPQVGAELARDGVLALLVSMLGILMYVSARFEFRYGLGAILALLHDVTLTIGLLVLVRLEISLTVLAAILTLIGYSLNDTIVVYDRVREMRAKYPNKTLVEVLNISVNSMLARTFMTGMTTLFVLAVLYLFGGPVLEGFAFTLLFGVVIGTYSSVFVASPLLLVLEEYYKTTDKITKV
ncbi:MAG: protein translocase subunit SecF [Alphaproteobacteria bacterium]